MIKILWLAFALNCDTTLAGATSGFKERRLIVQLSIVIEQLLLVCKNHYVV